MERWEREGDVDTNAVVMNPLHAAGIKVGVGGASDRLSSESDRTDDRVSQTAHEMTGSV